MAHDRFTRRRFLRDAIGAGGAALGATGVLAPATRAQTAPSDRVAVAFIGLGGMGRAHLGWFAAQPDVRIAGLCDVDSRHLDQARGVLSGKECPLYGDFRELIARPDIDAVVIATPDHWHGLTAIAAAKSGKHVYCEKPLTNSIAEGRALCQAVKQGGVVLQTGSHERSNPGAAIAKRLVDEGRLGEIHTVRIQLPTDDPHLQKVKNFTEVPPSKPVPEQLDYDFWLGPAPEASFVEERCHFWWRFVSHYGGGEMTDRGCHVIDLAQMILGRDATGPTRVEATGVACEGLYDAFFDFRFQNEFAEGPRMIGAAEGERGLWLEGDKGRLFVNVHGAKLKSEPESLLAGVEQPEAKWYDGHRREFLDATRTGAATIAPAEAGHRTATICHLNNLAMRLGRGFDWDPVAEWSSDDEVNRLLAPEMRAPWALEA